MIYTNESSASSLEPAILKALRLAVSLDIAVGYLGSSFSAKVEKAILNLSKKGKVRLLLGMYFHKGMNEKTYARVLAIDKSIRKGGILGSGVYVSRREYHGKLYRVILVDDQAKVFLGSSNLSPAGLEKRLECNIELSQSSPVYSDLGEYLDYLFAPEIAIDFSKVDLLSRKKPSVSDLAKYCISKAEFSKLQGMIIGECKIDFRPDSQPRSSLNLFFDKGRRNNEGVYSPRDWYEIELTTTVPERANPCFPKSNSNSKKKDAAGNPVGKSKKGNFTGFFEFRSKYYRIPMVVSGDNAKDLMSAKPGGRKLLGEFIKGSLEDRKALPTHQRVNSSILESARLNALIIKKVSDQNYILELSYIS